MTADQVAAPAGSITRALAAFVAGTRFADLPPEVVAQAKRLWIDSLGVTVAGAREPLGEMIAAHVAEQGARAECAVVGRDLRSSAALAALANATMAHALDYDDISVTWLGHPSGVLVPAVLALGTRLGASGSRALAAYVVGWETGAALGRSYRHLIHEAGWHSGGVTGAIAAAAACANLFRLDEGRTRTALGIAVSLAAGMYLNRGTDTKPLHAGNAARNGILAADLAGRGFSASDSAFDGPGNFGRTLVGEDCDGERMLAGLGVDWDILAPGGTIKLHACCGASHYCLDALLQLVTEHDLRPEAVEEVQCHVPPRTPGILLYHRPKTGLEAKFSLEYAVAAALLDRRAGIPQFTDEAVNRPAAQALLRRVRYVHPPGMEDTTREIVAQPHRVVVRLLDGRELEGSCRFFRGRAENPLNRKELVGKFRDCAAGTLDRPAQDAVLELVDGLEKVADVAHLDALLQPR
jgi:2-methylcitrate dehydratase PrpD